VPNRLADAVSPYLRSHAANPVDWFAWGPEPFDEARRRDVPVLVSIGYSTCHWCHVMARESFSDEALAGRLNRSFVAIKVDREEHPDVDASYLAAASAFTGSLGWPLTVFVTPEGRAFFAGTYFPPTPVQNVPSFSQVLDAVEDAWLNRRDEVEQNAGQIAEALAAQAERPTGSGITRADVARVVTDLQTFEDAEHGGFGGAPKFPVAPVQLLLLEAAAGTGSGAGGDPDADAARALSTRTLLAMARSPLRDAVEGGFFRYSTRRDWADPHYERMLYDNAQLLRAYSRLSALPGVAPADSVEARDVAAGIAAFLLTTLRRPEGGFGSAQDSESALGEGGYYALDAAGRTGATPPAVDDKVLTGWNGLALGALAEAGARAGEPSWIAAATAAATRILDHHTTPDGRLLRAATARGVSAAVATLEDYGMLAEGLLRLAIATGEASWAVTARRLVDECLLPGDDARVFTAPGGGDPVLAGQGLALASDPSEGAYPSGLSAMASAALLLAQLGAGGGTASYRAAASRAVETVSDPARESPIAFGAALSVGSQLTDPATQLVVVGEGDLADVARTWFRPGAVSIAVTEAQAAEWTAAGFELFEGRALVGGRAAAYLCRDFVCRLPDTDPAALVAQLA
jgi:hypothetical protein